MFGRLHMLIADAVLWRNIWDNIYYLHRLLPTKHKDDKNFSLFCILQYSFSATNLADKNRLIFHDDDGEEVSAEYTKMYPLSAAAACELRCRVEYLWVEACHV